jgi:hypothetical protein
MERSKIFEVRMLYAGEEIGNLTEDREDLKYDHNLEKKLVNK